MSKIKMFYFIIYALKSNGFQQIPAINYEYEFILSWHNSSNSHMQVKYFFRTISYYCRKLPESKIYDRQMFTIKDFSHILSNYFVFFASRRHTQEQDK